MKKMNAFRMSKIQAQKKRIEKLREKKQNFEIEIERMRMKRHDVVSTS